MRFSKIIYSLLAQLNKFQCYQGVMLLLDIYSNHKDKSLLTHSRNTLYMDSIYILQYTPYTEV